ncbi:Glycosyltransferase (GlcNAc), putative [Angomonas deanei]|uniref:Glycosyltransferase (GlcNAc), putative n=1 Tax=Angomonas deanei TaxID=59799 RepID=A0A7G2CA05_9TRYP|nr:Glycosyltransferase (GlcNAc), putative [Angomonas deanei]
MSELKERPPKSVEVVIENDSPSAYHGRKTSRASRTVAHSLTGVAVFLVILLLLVGYSVWTAHGQVGGSVPTESKVVSPHADVLAEVAAYLSLLEKHGTLADFVQTLYNDTDRLQTLLSVKGSAVYDSALYSVREETEVQFPTESFTAMQLTYAAHRSGNTANYSAGDITQASFAPNRVFYYPMRRYQEVRPYSAETPASVHSWHTAVMSAMEVPVKESLRHNYFTSARVSDIVHHSSPSEKKRFEDGADKGSVFVSFAAYRDVECGPTLIDLMQKAKNIHRIHVGIAQQNTNQDEKFRCIPPELRTPVPCFNPSSPTGGQGLHYWAGTVPDPHDSSFSNAVCVFSENIRIRRIRAERARGPTYGRFVASLLYRGEDWMLVLDSHNRFRPMFDAFLLSYFLKLKEENAVFSHYPEEYALRGTKFNFYRETTAYLCGCKFTEFGYPKFSANVVSAEHTGYKNIKRNEKYSLTRAVNVSPSTNIHLPQPFIAGGFLLGRGDIIRDISFDPFLGDCLMGRNCCSR